MNELEQARKDINRIDAEMLHLFEQRMKDSRTIADYKKQNALSVRDPARESELISRNRALLTDSEIEPYYVDFMRGLLELSSKYQSTIINGMTVAYCGAEGAYGYIAAKSMFPYAHLVAYSSFESAYMAVEEGKHECAVLPIENSYAGEVGTVMDMLFSGGLYVNQVIDLQVDHCLIASEGARLDNIKTVVSHPQALRQCEDYIRRHGFEVKEYSNTALAARFVKENADETVAAIASAETAEIFGLTVLDGHINVSKQNTTRFAALSRMQNRPATPNKREDENFLLVFTVQNEAGALAQTLNIIGAHGFNMRSLRSRPMKNLVWKYFFYIEAEGNINTANGRDMMQELSAICAELKLVGTYYANNI